MNTENREDLQQLIGQDYQLQWIIGHGGMSTVWLADDPGHGREVAIKVLRPEFSSNEEFLTRFRNEALAAEGINSPNVVATYDYREVTSPAGFTMCFIVMEYIRGESLADMIAREGQLQEDLALDVLEQAAHGLAVIHRMGLVHRDIKPGNLMITQNGQIKITDFGIAKAAATVPLTRTGMVVGTAQYVSPEQAQGLKVTSASDVYSLGVVGYEMLSGTRPFTGDSSVSVALAHVSAEPPPLPITVSAQARELIEVALRKDPNNRYRDGNEFQLSIARVREGQRPAQPGGQTQVIATEPTPTESTQMLADVSVTRTARPASSYPPSAARAVAAERRGAGTVASTRAGNVAHPQRQEKGSRVWPVLAGILALLLLGGVGAWAYTAGVFDRGTGPTTTPATPTVVTETETVDPEPETVITETQTYRPTVERDETGPGTLTFEDPTTSASQREDQPEPAQPTAQQTQAPTQATNAPTGQATQAPTPSQPADQAGDAPAVELPGLEDLIGGGTQ